MISKNLPFPKKGVSRLWPTKKTKKRWKSELRTLSPDLVPVVFPVSPPDVLPVSPPLVFPVFPPVVFPVSPPLVLPPVVFPVATGPAPLLEVAGINQFRKEIGRN